MTSWKPIAVAVAAALALLACGNVSAPSNPAPGQSQAPAGPTSNQAADLRTKLDLLLGEHLILAAKATGAALAGQTDEFMAYDKQLNTNGTELGAMIGSVYGADAQNKFNTIWSAHDGFFVDYTVGTAKNDANMKQTAVNNLLTQYVPQFSQLIAGATGLPQDSVAALIQAHVVQTKAIVDDQAAKNYTQEYTDLQTAFDHMVKIGDALAAAIAKQKSIPGDAASKAVDFRVTLNHLLQEHLYVATMATNAALQGRTDEFTAAGKLLNDNGTTIGAAIGSLYGPDAQNKFNTIWSAHNGFFVDYTEGVAKNDSATKAQAVNNLTTQYIPQFSAFIAGATSLPKDAVANLTKDHVLTTKQVVDDQGAKNYSQTAADDVTAAAHMQMIGDPLAAAIVKALPAKFQ